MWRNTADTHGRVSILLHWLIATVVPGLFVLGLWMVELDYYHAWYYRAPELHKGVGVLLLGVLLMRMAWRWINLQPLLTGTPLQQRLASAMHRLLYVVLFAIIISGYLVSTANGRPIEVEPVGQGADPWGGYRMGFTGTTRLKLADYGIDYDPGPASREVDLFFSIEGIRQ